MQKIWPPRILKVNAQFTLESNQQRIYLVCEYYVKRWDNTSETQLFRKAFEKNKNEENEKMAFKVEIRAKKFKFAFENSLFSRLKVSLQSPHGASFA